MVGPDDDGAGGLWRPIHHGPGDHARRKPRNLDRSLEAWKGGISQKDLATGSPALFFQDDTYRRGTPLTSYAFEGEGKVVGSGMSYIVNLTLKGSGEKENKVQRVAYRVVTRPSLAVTREEGIP